MSRELSEWFVGAAAKRLSEVEVNPGRSNQHEFQATTLVREFLGDTKDKRTMPARFVYLADETEPLVVSSWVTYYDARANNLTRNAEYRLYYPDNDVTRLARSGDTLVVASLKDGSCLVAIGQASGTYASQLLWLFDIHLGATTSFTLADSEAFSGALTPVDVDVLLEMFGIEVELNTPRDLELVTAKFGTSFPTTVEFSAFARECSDGPHPLDDPDGALLSWWDTEYRLFQAFERATVEERLSTGFDGPSAVEDFLKFSLSVQNRRKSRSGYAFEHHIACVLNANSVEFARRTVTERGSKPDFLLPSQAAYDDKLFPSEQLRMLAAKTTAKDRWRQVIPEADRIHHKHLLTLEPAISPSQTQEMEQLGIQLVVPRTLHATYSSEQQDWLWTLADFIHDASRG